ncbi:MAG: hypothetical protein HY343_10390 [Lentisphaerae bacterium]|nr:hypothetical protein [Lentisphaerota bacterium]
MSTPFGDDQFLAMNGILDEADQALRHSFLRRQGASASVKAAMGQADRQALWHGTKADRTAVAIRLYRKEKENLLKRQASAGEWENLLFHYQRYCGYRMDSLYLRAESGGKISPSMADWRSALRRAEKRAKKAESETGARMDRSICLQLGKALTSADALCDTEQWAYALVYYEKLLNYLRAFGTDEGEWGAVARHLGVYTCYRIEIIRSKLAPLPSVETVRYEPADTRPGFMNAALADHLVLGTRLTAFKLHLEGKHYFMGYLDSLEEEQDWWPTKLFAQWLFTPYAGLELTWDQVTANLLSSDDIPHNDGVLSLRGPIATLIGQYPNETIFTPYAGVGAGWFQADFDPNPIWHNGFGREVAWFQAAAEYEAWRAAGSPEWPNDGYQRILEPEDTYGLVVTAGSSIGINRHWAADLYLRYMRVDMEAHYTRRVFGEVIEDRGVYTFPLNNYAAGLGVKYLF